MSPLPSSMSIIFQKIPPYTVPSDPSGRARLLMGLDNPSSLVGIPSHYDIPVLCSPLKRAALTVQGPRITHLPELREIPFDVNLLTSKEERTSLTSVIVRRAFLRGWESDSLLITRLILQKEVIQLLDYVRPYEDCLVISHSFRLKIIQGYLQFGDAFFVHANLLGMIMREDQRTFAFNEQFTLEH